MSLKQRVLNILIAADQFFGTVVTFGALYPDETLSSYAYRLERKDKRGGLIFRPLIDGIFKSLFNQDDHCKKSYEEERLRYQFPPDLRNDSS